MSTPAQTLILFLFLLLSSPFPSLSHLLVISGGQAFAGQGVSKVLTFDPSSSKWSAIMDTNMYYHISFLTHTTFVASDYDFGKVDLFTIEGGRFVIPSAFILVKWPSGMLAMPDLGLVAVSSEYDRTDAYNWQGTLSETSVFFFDINGRVGQDESEAVASLVFTDGYYPEYIARSNHPNEVLVSAFHTWGHKEEWDDPDIGPYYEDYPSNSYGPTYYYDLYSPGYVQTKVYRRCIPGTSCDSIRDTTVYETDLLIYGLAASTDRFFVAQELKASGEGGEILSCHLDSRDSTAAVKDTDCSIIIKPSTMGNPTCLYIEEDELYVGTLESIVHVFDLDGNYLRQFNQAAGDASSITAITGKPGVWPHGSELVKKPVGNAIVAGQPKTLELELKDGHGIPISSQYGVEDFKREVRVFECRAEGEVLLSNNAFAKSTIYFPVRNNTSGSVTADITLQNAGLWNITMDYTLRGQVLQVLGSPFTMEVAPAELDSQSVEVSFEGLVVAGEVLRIRMVTTDVYGNLNPINGGPEDLVITFEDDQKGKSFGLGQNAELIYHKKMRKSGSSQFSIETVLGYPIRGSPFVTVVQPALAVASKSYYIEDITKRLKDGVLDSSIEFVFQIVVRFQDAYENNSPHSKATVTVAGISDVVDGSYEVSALSTPPYSISFQLPEKLESTVTVTVLIDGTIVGEVFSFDVAPGTNIVLIGGLSAAAAVLVVILVLLWQQWKHWKQNRQMVARVRSLNIKLQRQRHTEKELEVMKKAMDDLDQERSDELKNVLIFSSEIEFKGTLGQGAFGTVSLGIYQDKKVAVKHLNTVDEESVSRFRFECFLMKELRHPNIVKLVGVCWDEMLLGCVLEFVSGGSLEDVLQKDWSLPVEEKRTWKQCYLKFAQETAGACRYLHNSRYWSEDEKQWKNCVIHRDLKPDNMLVTEQNVLKLTDFGEARAEELNMTMTSVGTPIYISPEVMANDRYDSKADVYSFAVVLVAMIRVDKNIIEFHFNSLMKHLDRNNRQGLGITMLNRKMSKGWRPPLPVEFYPKLKKLIIECWSQRPEDRPDFDHIEKELNGEIALQVMANNEPVFGSGDVAEIDKEIEELRRMSGRNSAYVSSRLTHKDNADGDTDDEIELITMRHTETLEKLRASEVKIKMLEELLEQTRRNQELGISKPAQKVDQLMNPEYVYAKEL